MKLFEFFVFTLFLRGNKAYQTGEFFTNEESNFPHVRVYSQNNLSLRIKVVADQLFARLCAFGLAYLMSDLF